MLFGHLERRLDVPVFSVDPDNVLVGTAGVGGQDGEPSLVAAIPDENYFCREAGFQLDQGGAEDFRLAGPLADIPVYGVQIPGSAGMDWRCF